MELRFRPATPEDIPAICVLIAASVRQLQVEYSPQEREAAIATVFTVDSRLIADGTYLLAFAPNVGPPGGPAGGQDDSPDGALAGCGGWSRRKTLYGGDHQLQIVESDLLDPATDAAKIRAIFVHPDFARQGVGSEILKQSEQAAIADGFTRFEMGSTLAGVALYRSRGYREVETLQVPVGPGESIAVVRMTKMR